MIYIYICIYIYIYTYIYTHVYWLVKLVQISPISVGFLAVIYSCNGNFPGQLLPFVGAQKNPVVLVSHKKFQSVLMFVNSQDISMNLENTLILIGDGCFTDYRIDPPPFIANPVACKPNSMVDGRYNELVNDWLVVWKT